MGEPDKPFACTLSGCGMSFTNEDHLHVHTKKHDMMLQFGLEQKTAFVADQTPTPTRFIRNCEEVGLFQDLQNVNPFDEGFKRAMETKSVPLSLESMSSSSDELHTPQMMFPVIDCGDRAMYTTSTNNQRNITISRSSSDESGTVKEYETTTISKLTNEVTTISRVIEKQELVDKIVEGVETQQTQKLNSGKDIAKETSVSYKNNVIFEIRKDGSCMNMDINKAPVKLISYTDSVIKDTSVINKDVMLIDVNKVQVTEDPLPLMSQKSIELVVDKLTAECQNHSVLEKNEAINSNNLVSENSTTKVNQNMIGNSAGEKVRNLSMPQKKIKPLIEALRPDQNEDFEVVIKFPNGKRVRMKPMVEENTSSSTNKLIEDATKRKLKRILNEKADKKMQKQSEFIKDNPGIHGRPVSGAAQIIPKILPMSNATFLPVIINSISQPVSNPVIINNTSLSQPLSNPIVMTNKICIKPLNLTTFPESELGKKKKFQTKFKTIDLCENLDNENKISDDIINNRYSFKNAKYISISNLDMKRAAAKRYRIRLKEKMLNQLKELEKYKAIHRELINENISLKEIIREHQKVCKNFVASEQSSSG